MGSRGWKGFVGSHPLISVAPLNVLRTHGARSTPSRSAPPRPLPRLLPRGRRSLSGDRVLYAPVRPGQPVGIAADDFEPSVVELQKVSCTSSPACGGAFQRTDSSKFDTLMAA